MGTICLRNYMEGDDGWGRAEGRLLYDRLLKEIEAHSGEQIFVISLDGVRRTDASFPRESVVELAVRFRGIKGFCLIDAKDADLLENWDAAALRRNQPITVWMNPDESQLLGPRPKPGLVALFEYAITKPRITASEAAKVFDLKINNASMKLKQLLEGGYLLRSEETSSSGGIEFVYYRIKPKLI